MLTIDTSNQSFNTINCSWTKFNARKRKPCNKIYNCNFGLQIKLKLGYEKA